jgi:hypothetical protein
MTQEEQIWNQAFEKSHVGKEMQPPLVKYRKAINALETIMYYSDPLRVHTELDYQIIYKAVVDVLKEKWVDGTNEQSNYWRDKYEGLKREVENVSDFFAKYERRVI